MNKDIEEMIKSMEENRKQNEDKSPELLADGP